jgi:hypothetical protein
MPTIVITLGSQATVTSLFAYPNTGHAQQTLAQTIELYLTNSMQRENAGALQVAAQVAADPCTVSITGQDAGVLQQIKQRYQAFFDTGQIGLKAANAFRAKGQWSNQWQFFLPLGIPLAFAKAVEVMDFPPVSLIQNQDYLNSKTTSRWWELLMLNGVTDQEKVLYSCILDIVPVAAPADDGAKLQQSGIYNGPFDVYDLPLLQTLVSIQGTAAYRPLIALGLPIRDWINRIWKLVLDVGQIGTVKLKNGDVCNVIGCNHPSFFFYAIQSNTGVDAAKKNLAYGLAVMKQDIVCAAWHAGMGRTPGANPKQVLADATAQWAGKDAQLLALVKKQAGVVPAKLIEVAPEELETVHQFEPTKEQLKPLEKRFHEDTAH